MKKNIDKNVFEVLQNAIKSGLLTTKEIITKAEKEVKAGNMNPEMLTFIVQYFNMMDKFKDDEYINADELIKLGLYDTMDEIKQVLSENPDLGTKKIYPLPTEEEINQHIDTDDLNRVCIICMTKRRHVIFLPCGHHICCTVCTKELVQKADAETAEGYAFCPICKKKIKKIQRIFT